MITVPMIKGESGPKFTTWHFDPRILLAIGLGASGATVQYGNDYPLIPALICEATPQGLVAVDYTTILPELELGTIDYAKELTEYIENCSLEDLTDLYDHVFGTGSAAQKAQLTALPQYELNRHGPDHIQLTMNSFINGHYTAEDGTFFYAIKDMEASVEVDFNAINTSWPFVNWYKKA